MNNVKEGKRTPALFVIFLFVKVILVTLSQNRKQNLETLYKCQIRRFLSDPLLDLSRISIGGDVSAHAEFAEKLSPCLPLHPFYPSLSPDSSACYLTLGFSQGPDKQADKPKSMLVFHTVLSTYLGIFPFN